MEENEIIECLKRNRELGRVFIFLPYDVQCWCDMHSDELIYYSWKQDKFLSNNGMDITQEDILALEDDY